MTIALDVPGRGPLELAYLLLDVNGTLSDRGRLLDGVAERIGLLRERLEPRLLSADTFGSAGELASRPGLALERVADGQAKLRALERLGAARCAAVGNGANDAELLRRAALGIAVVGPEGAAGTALAAADVVCGTIVDALELLLDRRALTATLRR